MTKKKLLELLNMSDRISYRMFKKNFCGELIGRGCYRRVYQCSLSPLYVIKMNHPKWPRAFGVSNVVEWTMWNEIQAFNPKMKKYYAPVIWINDQGSISVQRKVAMKSKKFYPKKIPHFFGDLKTGNYGWIGQRFVCSDYGNTFITREFNPKRKKPGKFRLDYGRRKI